MSAEEKDSERERALKRENKGEEEEEGKIYIQGKKKEREKDFVQSSYPVKHLPDKRVPGQTNINGNFIFF